jgi:hypothetical protein
MTLKEETLTPLEKEILKAWHKADIATAKAGLFTMEDYAKAAAEVAKRYIEKAYDDGFRTAVFKSREKIGDSTVLLLPHQERIKWLKSNGVTE